MAASYLVIIGDREPLAWVLSKQRMAFPGHRAGEVAALREGDELLLYATRGCFHNPTRGRGRVIGRGSATSAVRELDEPLKMGGREFPIGCTLAVESLAALGDGVELAPLVPQLSSFPSKAGWAMRMRRPLLALTTSDAALLRRKLKPVAGPPSGALAEYVAVGRTVAA